MSMMKVFLNLSTFIRLGRVLIKMVNNAIAKQGNSKLPETKDLKELLEIIRGLLERGVIDFPGVDEMQIAQGIKQLEDQMVLTLENAEINLAKFGDLNPRFGMKKDDQGGVV